MIYTGPRAGPLEETMSHEADRYLPIGQSLESRLVHRSNRMIPILCEVSEMR